MTKPLALCCSENLLLGNQLANRLQDLGYQAQISSEPRNLLSLAVQEHPFVVILDLACRSIDICQVIRDLRQNAATGHIPILAFASKARASVQTAAHSAGAALVAIEDGMIQQLPELLDRVLDVG